MRKVIIPIIYERKTGKWLNICGLTYDSEENIIQVDSWDGDGVVIFNKGDFIVDEDKVLPLHQ